VSLEKRIERLEGRIELPKDEAAELRHAIRRDIIHELGRLKAERAQGYRGGKPPIPVQPTDPAGEVLGYPYTHGQLAELAIRRVFGRETNLSPEETEELIRSWTEEFKDLFEATLGQDWDEVECWDPPEPTPPYHSPLAPGGRPARA
jgi:hypothetical protein